MARCFGSNRAERWSAATASTAASRRKAFRSEREPALGLSVRSMKTRHIVLLILFAVALSLAIASRFMVARDLLDMLQWGQ